MNDYELILAAETGKARAAALKAQAEFATLAPPAQGVSSLTDEIKDGLAEIVRQHGEVYGRIVPAAAWLLAWLAENESGVSEPVEQQPVAWRADWPDWRKYHDETDPLPATWDCEVPTITPLYTRAGVDAVMPSAPMASAGLVLEVRHEQYR